MTLMRYTVVDNRTDFPVCVCATACEAKEKMGLKTIGPLWKRTKIFRRCNG